MNNSELESSSIKALTEELARATRCHWIRDVTFNEDHIKTKAGNQTRVMALLRGLGIELTRKTSPKNFQAAIGSLSDSIANLESMLRQVRFLWESRGPIADKQDSNNWSAGRFLDIPIGHSLHKPTKLHFVRRGNKKVQVITHDDISVQVTIRFG